MADPIIGAVAPICLRRSCERNRLEKQFLINAYEHLVALVTPAEQDNGTDDDVVPQEESSKKHAAAREACGSVYR
jgi:hypothetical protein